MLAVQDLPTVWYSNQPHIRKELFEFITSSSSQFLREAVALKGSEGCSVTGVKTHGTYPEAVGVLSISLIFQTLKFIFFFPSRLTVRKEKYESYWSCMQPPVELLAALQWQQPTCSLVTLQPLCFWGWGEERFCQALSPGNSCTAWAGGSLWAMQS